MSEQIRPTTGFIVGMAFMFATGFGALVLVGAGAMSLVLGQDDLFAFGQSTIPGYGVVLTVVTALIFALAALRSGYRIAGRVSFFGILGIALSTWACGLIVEVIASLTLASHDPLDAALVALFAYLLAPEAIGLIIFIAAAIAGWAYLGTLRWQARNAQTKQFAHPEQ